MQGYDYMMSLSLSGTSSGTSNGMSSYEKNPKPLSRSQTLNRKTLSNGRGDLNRLNTEPMRMAA